MREVLSNEREVALRCAAVASNICQRVRQKMVTREAITKADRSPVTVADYGSQAVVCRILKEAFPSDPIVAEEASGELRSPRNARVLSTVTDFVRSIFSDASDRAVCEWIDLGARKIARRYWCLDPIDGTKGFLRGDQYAVALALVINGEVRLGVLACPNLPVELDRSDGPGGVVFLAIRGEGAFQMRLDDPEVSPIHVSYADRGEEIRFCESVEPGHADLEAHGRIGKRLGIVQPSIQMDSQAKYGIVARGDASIYLRLPSPKTPDYKEKVWDHAAGTILVEEAGGRVSDTFGEPLDFGVGYRLTQNTGVIATNGRLHERVLAALRS